MRHRHRLRAGLRERLKIKNASGIPYCRGTSRSEIGNMKGAWHSWGLLASLAVVWWVGCASNDTPPPLHSVIRMERTPETRIANGNTGAVTNLTISDWETNHFQPAAGAGYGAGGGVTTGSGSSSGQVSGSVGFGSSTSASALGTTNGRPVSGTVTNTGGGVVTPLPSLSTPSSTSTNSSTFGLPGQTNSFGLPR